MNTNVQNPTDFEELLDGMTANGRYDYLRIILTKNGNRTIPQEYLMVTKKGFSLVKLKGVDYDSGRIHLDFECAATGDVKQIHLDIEDTDFKFILVSWQDLRKMVVDDCSCPDDKLLDFEF